MGLFCHHALGTVVTVAEVFTRVISVFLGEKLLNMVNTIEALRKALLK